MSLPAMRADADDAGSQAPDGEAAARRITASQYRQIITDVFGPTIELGGRFEPDVRRNGLLAVGEGEVSVTATGFEQYDANARTVAAQVVSEKYRSSLIPCQPAAANKPDDACAAQFFTSAGGLLYRRPLDPAELADVVKGAHEAADRLGSFYDGLGLGLSSMLVSPQFLFRISVLEKAANDPAKLQFDAYSKAAQLSFFLWNTAPDDALLAAAKKGELDTQSGLARQVDRLLASPRLQAGVRAFFSDMLQFEDFSILSKDPMIYPKFTPNVAQLAPEQTLRTITDLLLTHDGDYRDLFTTRKTFLTPVLASIYGVPFAVDGRNGAPESWAPHEYPEGDSRAGILSQISFVALHSHPGRSSPTLRGRALREAILCQQVPNPPGNVNFAVVQDTSNPVYKTARARLGAHATEPTCKGCHKIMDPVGLALENFDSSGGFRTSENGEAIDTSGSLDGLKFTNASEFGKMMHDTPAATTCLVHRLYTYAVGHTPRKEDADIVKSLNAEFQEGGYRLSPLLRKIATSDQFYEVSVKTKTAAN